MLQVEVGLKEKKKQLIEENEKVSKFKKKNTKSNNLI